MKMNSVDISAKLLATENITVVRSNVSTASFDIRSRVLTLPQWKDMTPEQEEMLVGHEVGHALYTTEAYTDTIKEQMSLMSYLNVIEDVRIEKLIKREYPGIRKVMSEGYRQLNEKDFFGISKIPDLSSLNLIDRINLYFKAGYQCGVKFTPEEKVMVDAVERNETEEEVIALAKQVYAYSKQEAEKRLDLRLASQTEQDKEDEEDDIIEQDFDDMFDDSNLGENSFEEDEDADEEKPTLGRDTRNYEEFQQDLEERRKQQLEQELESVTDKVFQEKLEALADTNTQYYYYNLEETFKFDPIVDYKRILLETKVVDEHLSESNKVSLEKFKNESSRIVSYLIKEFEMRKSATLYKRAQTSKSGSLDMKKIWAYKLNDDLFRRVTTIPEGKNHGMVFLLDWSGSMDFVLEDTMQQVISLAMFCHRSQIPYQVFAFSSQYSDEESQLKMHDLRREFYHDKNIEKVNNTCKLSNAIGHFSLLELFSSKMSNVEFNTMMRRVINPHMLRYVEGGQYGTGGTPLNEALSYMVSYLPKFAKVNNVEKMSLITLTDGDGHMLQGQNSYSMRSYGYDANYSKRSNMRHFLQDPQTKQSYEIFDNGHSQTEAIIRMIKDRYSINIVGFYICENRRRDLSSAIRTNISGYEGNVDTMIDIFRNQFRDKGFASIKSSGRDDLFIVPINKLKVDDSEMVVAEKQTAKQIARSFTKNMTGRKTSRVLLNQFIGYVA